MALLERGLRRSRRGELASGQEDLLWACRSFDALALRADQELCLSHLANHQKRAGDYDAALNNLTQLLDSARRRQARQDEGIYLYNIALVRAEQGQWEPARAAYTDALAIETEKDDAMGIVYAEHGLADALLELKRPDEALAHIERAQKRRAEVDDPVQLTRVGIVHARALAATGRPAEAAELLRMAQPAVRASTDRLLLGQWLRPQAEVQALLGHWREAYEAQFEHRAIDAALQAQRLSGQLARLRLQFDRERDEAAIRGLQQANLQGQQLRQVQAVALTLFVLLLMATLAYAVHKLREGRRLQTLALQDELTHLANRRAVFAHAAQLLPQARSRRSPLSVLMIDVDHFKQVNDTHGHALGDAVLKHLAALLPASLRSLDRLGRIGGEEFLALLPDATLEQATAIAERMRASVAATPLATPAGALAPTVSIGVATLSGALESVEALVERADRALYRAKAEGRNRVASDAG